MSIQRVEIKDFLVFKGDFTAAFCPGVNVLIGGNGTGKTTLLRTMYFSVIPHIDSSGIPKKIALPDGPVEFNRYDVRLSYDAEVIKHAVYIPEKDILEHAQGLLTFITKKQTGFGQVYRAVLIDAQDTPTQKQSKTQESIGQKVASITGGEVRLNEAEGYFYTHRKDGSDIPFQNEASGYKRLGYLGLLVRCGQLDPGSVLFWDEPENSLNPELMPVLVEILLELASHNVQIFIATHSYDLARYIDVRKEKSIPVMFHNLAKAGHQIICNSSPDYMGLPDNLLESASAELFKAVVSDAMEVPDDE